MKNPWILYESCIQKLIGNSLQKVIYHTFDDHSHKLMYDFPSQIHVVDYALIFQMESGLWYTFFCGAEFDQRGLDFTRDLNHPIRQTSVNVEYWDVSSHHNWVNFMGQTITDIHYHRQYQSGNGTPSLYSQYIQINFENRRSICLSPSQPFTETMRWHSSEEIMIVFDEYLAENQLKIADSD